MAGIERWNEVNGVTTPEERMEVFMDKNHDTYAIFQLRRTEETDYERFESYANLKRQRKEPDFDHYEVVYAGVLPSNLFTMENCDYALESLYERFNVDRPDDFTGHSMSVSDIVALKLRDQVSYHYVDRIGFQQLQDFGVAGREPDKWQTKDNYLKTAEMSVEDDYNSLDGIINNGPKEDRSERKSVLEQLKETVGKEPASLRTKKTEEREI